MDNILMAAQWSKRVARNRFFDRNFAMSSINSLIFIAIFHLNSQLAFGDLGAFQIALKPDPPQVGVQKIEVKIPGDRQPEKVDVTIFMPAMGTMPYMEEKTVLTRSDSGIYKGEFQLSMGGTWEMVFTVPFKDSEIQKKAQYYYSLTTGIPGLNDKNGGVQRQNDAENKPLLSIGPERLQKIGVKTQLAKKMHIETRLRAVGVIEQDKTKRSVLALRFAGYVEKVLKGRVGDFVQIGTPIMSVYSPELMTAQSEFLLAQVNTESLTLKDSTYERLRNFGLSDLDIQRIKKSGKPERAMLISAPQSGHLLEVNAREGGSFSQGQTLYAIGDLTKNYIVARVFQREVRDIQVGQKAHIVITEGAPKKLKGQVDLIFPNVNEGDGTVNVRIVTEEPISQLNTGAFVDVFFPIDLGVLLVIPSSAVLFSGMHQYVFIDRGQGILEPREVVTGRSTEDVVEVLEGVAEGERVVQSGTFLLSSEAQLRSALPKWQSSSEGDSPSL